MKISGNKIIKIEEDDIIDGTFELPLGVTVVGKNAGCNLQNLVTIPEGIVEVEYGGFNYCGSLIEIPETLIKVGDYAFESCESLYFLPDSITKIGKGSFLNCESLTNIPKEITQIPEDAFQNCSSLVEIPNTVTYIGKGAFIDCTSLKIIPNTITVVEHSAFKNCCALETIPDSIQKIGDYAFFHCLSLTEIPDSVEEIGTSSFAECEKLVKISSNIKEVKDYSFQWCSSLKTMPDSIQKIGEYAFCGCGSLQKISSGITIVEDGAFSSCADLEEMPNSIITIKDSGFWDCPKLVKISNKVTTVGNGAFELCRSIKEMPNSIIEVGDRAFLSCWSLENMSESITKIGSESFKDCYSLKKISGHFDVVKSHAFQGCHSLETIPDTIRVVESNGFQNCKFLKEMPDSIVEVGNGAFQECQKLQNMSKNIQKIGEYSFYNCPSLKAVEGNFEIVEDNAFSYCKSIETIPNTIRVVKKYGFYQCTALIEIPNSIIEAEERAFQYCFQLENIPNQLKIVNLSTFANCKIREIPESVVEVRTSGLRSCKFLKEIPANVVRIGRSAFSECLSLKKITLGNIEYIRQGFTETAIEKLVTPYGEIGLNESNSHEIVGSYLYLYANSILQDKYKDISDFMSNFEIYSVLKSDAILADTGILKFKKLFFKMRKSWNINGMLFERFSVGMIEKFQLKVWNEIDNLIDNWKTSPELTEALAEIIEVFGVFENDKQQRQRIETLKEIFLPSKFTVLEETFESFEEGPKRDFEKIQTPYYYFNSSIIPEEFQVYLNSVMSERYVHKLKKLTGSYGKRINDFIKNEYKVLQRNEYRIKEDIKTKSDHFQECIHHFFYCFLNEQITYEKVHQIFDGCRGPFNPDFYEFLIENWVFILENEKTQSYVKIIQEKFPTIQEYYASVGGTERISLKQAMDYIMDNDFEYHPGNKEVAKEVQNAGVVSQEAFNYYQEVFEKNQVRRKTSLIKRKSIYEIDGFKIKAELLRKDEIEAALVGEVNNTNCCQVYGGVGHNCMAHAVYSDDGGVFVTKLIEGEQEILLTQSWDWQNNNVYCHDNIEGTTYLKKNKKLQAAVSKVFQMDGEFIIEKSKNEVENYITARKKTIEKSLMSETEKEKELFLLREMEERQVIRVVTSGAGNNDLRLSNYFSSSIFVDQSNFLNNQTFILTNFQPIKYNDKQAYFDKDHSAYTDSSKKQYIIAGSLENLCLGKQEPLVPIYKDERRITHEKENIRDFTFHKMKEIEESAYPKEMHQYQSSGEENFIKGNSQIYLGEDWYLVYEEKDDQTVYISDLARIDPTLQEESKEQLDEMNHTIQTLLEQYEVIEADLKEDTSYLLYLMNKKRGYIEQIGEDKQYSFNHESEQAVITEEEQQEILRDIKTVKENKNPENRMHHVTFKKGPRFEKEQNAKSK